MLHSNGVKYLLIGGYAVNYYGYARSTGDMDIWVDRSPANAEKLAAALRALGFASVTPALFTEADSVIRMGVPPLRLEILTSVSGLEFEECYTRRQTVPIEDILIHVVCFDDLKTNKRAAGRAKDLADLEGLTD